MTSSQYLWTAVVLAAGSLFAATPILKGGSAKLSEPQLAELKSISPDPIAMMCPLGMFGAAYFSPGQPWSMVGVIVVVLALAIRFPYRLWKMSWPFPARRSLVIGNILMSVGTAAAALVYVSQYL